MAWRVRTVRDIAEYGAALAAIGHYFGWAPTKEDSTRFSKVLPFDGCTPCSTTAGSSREPERFRSA